VVPHAGYVYSGQTAANMYNIAKQFAYKKAIIVAPSHYSNACDFFIGDYQAYQTPLGTLHTDRDIIKNLSAKPDFAFDKSVDVKEHALETQLPFLYYILPDIKIIPIIFVRQNLLNAKRLCDHLVELIDEETLLVISTDLSHFHNAEKAEEKDRLLIEYIKRNDIDGFYDALKQRKIEACGFGGLLTLMYMRNTLGNVEIDDFCYTHSGHVNKDNNQVVGYLGCGLYRSATD
jgi:hypothetical protein